MVSLSKFSHPATVTFVLFFQPPSRLLAPLLCQTLCVRVSYDFKASGESEIETGSRIQNGRTSPHGDVRSFQSWKGLFDTFPQSGSNTQTQARKGGSGRL